MAGIETLTEDDRAALDWPMPHRAESKALRIIDALTEALAAAQTRVEMLETCHAPNLRVAAAEVRVRELEAALYDTDMGAALDRVEHEIARADAAESRVRELEAQAVTVHKANDDLVERHLESQRNVAAAALRVRELEAENGSLNSGAWARAAEAHLAKLEVAEARVRELEELLDMAGTGKGEAESRLATATALIERIVKYASEDRAMTPGTTRLARALSDAVAFLAGQPAAPESLLMKASHWSEGAPPGCHCPPDRCGAPVVMGRQMPCRRQPAAPLPGWDDIERKTAAPTRTEAEQAVLDVVRRWVDGDVTSVAHIAQAELALRGLK